MVRRWISSSNLKPLVFLLFVPVIIAELLTGSTPLPSLLNPATLPTLVGLYGAGALLVRELTVVWKRGWPSVFALGAAYGVVEEALDVKSWFNPHWAALGLLGTYGRVLGVNWVWAIELTVFHSVFSIAIPILLVTLLFPASASSRWLGGRRLALVASVFLVDVAIGFALFPYFPSPGAYLGALVLAGALVSLARVLPRPDPSHRAHPAAGSRRFALLGFGSAASFFAIFWMLPGLGVPPPAAILLCAVLCAVDAFILGSETLSARQAFALASGALAFLILVAIAPLDFAAGTPFVGAALAVALAALVRRAAGGLVPQLGEPT